MAKKAKPDIDREPILDQKEAAKALVKNADYYRTVSDAFHETRRKALIAKTFTLTAPADRAFSRIMKRVDEEAKDGQRSVAYELAHYLSGVKNTDDEQSVDTTGPVAEEIGKALIARLEALGFEAKIYRPESEIQSTYRYLVGLHNKALELIAHFMDMSNESLRRPIDPLEEITILLMVSW